MRVCEDVTFDKFVLFQVYVIELKGITHLNHERYLSTIAEVFTVTNVDMVDVGFEMINTWS